MAAKMGKHVISVDPYISNIYSAHKSINKEKLNERITLIYNVISDKANQKMLASKTKTQIKFLAVNKTIKDANYSLVKQNLSDNYLYTIVMDDLVDYLPKIGTSNELKFTDAIIKIDRESLEWLAFSNAQNLFNKLKISVVFMEWKSIK
jgi:hypothetical protein